MPMQWTPANDQLLLVALIQTHIITIDYSKIAEAWPEGGAKPTARAISERLIKIRKLNEGKMPATPTKNRAKVTVSTPTSSARKRKVTGKNIDDDDNESDAEGHRSSSPEYVTPKSRRTNKSKTVSNAQLPKTPSGDIDFTRIAERSGLETPSSKRAPIIKQEPSADDPFTSSFQSARLNRDMSAGITGPVLESNYSINSFDMPTPISGRGGSISNSPSNMDGQYDDQSLHSLNNPKHAGIGMHMGMGMSVGGMNMSIPVTTGHGLMNVAMDNITSAHPLMSTPTMNTSFTRINGPAGTDITPQFSRTSVSAAPSDVTIPGLAGSQTPVALRRTRTPRKASEGIQNYIKLQKEEDAAHGEHTSEEDSAESEFQEEDDDEI
ncbi:hypothetical protein BCR34DRAFT_615539 [Clohesyomyces aquaticus]|uniref:Uncharacterized protein n=1 Tax=Clohesyomyces aquaticus TaxID=1231657 RepID=A0A1Y1ZI57_9PLEO|nr:hypothetical protein BCR34DRAFT_615539 [Clohesyomyces aquaticus]